jgi:hypothetical protein
VGQLYLFSVVLFPLEGFPTRPMRGSRGIVLRRELREGGREFHGSESQGRSFAGSGKTWSRGSLRFGDDVYTKGRAHCRVCAHTQLPVLTGQLLLHIRRTDKPSK